MENLIIKQRGQFIFRRVVGALWIVLALSEIRFVFPVIQQEVRLMAGLTLEPVVLLLKIFNFRLICREEILITDQELEEP